MKRWDVNSMLELGKKLFAQIHRQKKHANHNHDVHIMAREIDEWLPQGIQSLIDGTYDPRCLKRYCFEDEVVDHVHLSDRILQHLFVLAGSADLDRSKYSLSLHYRIRQRLLATSDCIILPRLLFLLDISFEKTWGTPDPRHHLPPTKPPPPSANS